MNLTCNSTLEDLRILPTSETKIVGPLNFHTLALIIAGAGTLIAIAMSFYLIFMHAIHYTKPNEQKHIIRILFMVPVYAVASLLSIRYYWHAIYFQVISDCYEAFAISSFFALLCSYIAADLHEQKNFFRQIPVVKPWVLPINWFAKCCGGQRGPWRTPRSGLTWFNIIWIGIYHYCFIRVTMTITAVVTQYFGRYCESSNLPVFGHIWIIVIESIAVSIAMYCVIQFYIQLRSELADHQPFLKVLAIKLVIFLSFWQSAAISVGTSTLRILKANSTLAYPDIKVGIPSMLLCIEMACFAILHLWAFSYRPYLDSAPVTFYPVTDPNGSNSSPKPNRHHPRSGGFMGVRAILDALNIWDVVKAFGRGLRWLFVGIRHRRDDISYQPSYKTAEMDLDELSPDSFRKQQMGVVGAGIDTSYGAAMKSTDHLPIATEFRRSRFDMLQGGADAGDMTGPDVGEGDQASAGGRRAGGAGLAGVDGAHASGAPPSSTVIPSQLRRQTSDEAAGLIAYAQPMSSSSVALDSSPERYDDEGGRARGGRGGRGGGPVGGTGRGTYGDDEQQHYDAEQRHARRGGSGRRPEAAPTAPSSEPPGIGGDMSWGEAK